MARTEHGSSNPRAHSKYIHETFINKQLQDFEEERAQYRKMERDMTVKSSGQYSGHDYEKAIDKMDKRY